MVQMTPSLRNGGSLLVVFQVFVSYTSELYLHLNAVPSNLRSHETQLQQTARLQTCSHLVVLQHLTISYILNPKLLEDTGHYLANYSAAECVPAAQKCLGKCLDSMCCRSASCDMYASLPILCHLGATFQTQRKTNCSLRMFEVLWFYCRFVNGDDLQSRCMMMQLSIWRNSSSWGTWWGKGRGCSFVLRRCTAPCLWIARNDEPCCTLNGGAFPGVKWWKYSTL